MTVFHLTAKDAAYLNALLAAKEQDEEIRDLARRKLDAAELALDHAIDPRIATIDSRVEFSVGGGFAEERILTRDEKGPFPNAALPVTTARGLALLGLREGDVFALRKPNGITEPIRLIKVIHQPEAARRRDGNPSVVPFHPRRTESTGAAPATVPTDDDDPGPSAA